MRMILLLPIYLCALVSLGCTNTATVISNVRLAPQTLNVSSARIAILPFAGAADYPETGRVSREIATAILVQQYGITLISPSKVDRYLREHIFVPSEFDREALEVTARDLGADIVVWGKVLQFTPYRFDRLAPATPPYAEITIYGFRIGHVSAAKVTGWKQEGLPATIWSRQPSFEDVAQPLMVQLLTELK
jgi:hypothetical protein